MGRNPVVTVIAVIVLIVAVIFIIRGVTDRPIPVGLATWYDTGTNKLYGAKPDLVPPMPAPSGSEGVRAIIAARGSCYKEADRFIAYLEKYTDDGKVQFKEVQQEHPPDFLAQMTRISMEERLVRREQDDQWFPADSVEGQAIMSVVHERGVRLCGHAAGDERPLYRSWRRWRPIVLGVFLALLSTYPLIIAGGWLREQMIVHELTKRGHRAGVAVIRTGPNWLVDRLPKRSARLFHRAESVGLGPSGTDADLAECGKLSSLQMLLIDQGAVVTDEGLAHLKGLSQLHVLNVGGTRVTDAGLVHLKGLTQLWDLSLSGTQVTDAGLVHLKGLTQLRYLALSRTRVTDAGVVELQKVLPNVRVV